VLHYKIYQYLIVVVLLLFVEVAGYRYVEIWLIGWYVSLYMLVYL